MIAPMPLAPRPYPGEGISHWIARLAARYDISGDELGRLITDGRPDYWGGVSTLDYRANPDLEAILASAARIETTRIDRMRIVCGDGSRSCWHRDAPAWCPACLRSDELRDGEVHGRAAWRLGCNVLCPQHDALLDDRCRRCDARARCHYRPMNGRLKLTCDACEHPVVTSGDDRDASMCKETGFRVVCTPALSSMVRTLQRDLQAALAGISRPCAWGPVRSTGQLLVIASDLTLAVVWSAGLRVTPRMDPSAIARGQAGAASYEPITLALLSPSMAFGLMSLIAVCLEGFDPDNGGDHVWRPDGMTQPLTAPSFLAWLNANGLHLLHRVAAAWGHHACDAARRAIEAATRNRSIVQLNEARRPAQSAPRRSA